MFSQIRRCLLEFWRLICMLVFILLQILYWRYTPLLQFSYIHLMYIPIPTEWEVGHFLKKSFGDENVFPLLYIITFIIVRFYCMDYKMSFFRKIRINSSWRYYKTWHFLSIYVISDYYFEKSFWSIFHMKTVFF